MDDDTIIDMAGLDTFTPAPRTASARAFKRQLNTVKGRKAAAAAKAHALAVEAGASPEGAKVAAQLAARETT